MINKGLQNEKDIVDVLHAHRIRDLPSFWKSKIMELFDVDDESLLVGVRHLAHFNFKTDIELEVNKKTIKISIKSGISPTLHQEQTKYFIEFLKEQNVSEKTIKFVSYYLYGDGSLNGSGNKNIGIKYMNTKYSKNIHEANIELSDKELIKKFIIRTILKGRHENRQEIDYLYYGTAEGGVFVSKEEILDYATNSKCLHYRCLHIGPIMMIKDHKKSKTEANLVIKYVQMKWPTLWRDVNFINKTRRIIPLF